MKHILETGTDGACIAVFDAWALPADFDASAADDPREAAENAQRAGRCFFSDTGGDGGHVLHVYCDENVPSGLLAQATPIAQHDDFQVPSGRLFFTGAEDLCRDDLLEPAPTVSEQRAELPRGSYAARFYLMEAPGDATRGAGGLRGVERLLLAALPVFVSTAVIAVLAAALLLLGGGVSRGFALALMVASIAAAGAFVVERSRAYRGALLRRTTLRRERYPDFILALRSDRAPPRTP